MIEQLVMVGVSHRTATLALLERTSVPRPQRATMLRALRGAGCAEAVVLSTCSRTEIYTRGGRVTGHLALLGEHAGLPASEVEAAAEVHTGADAVLHLFQVTAGLRSRLIGEVDVLGQVRGAFREAHAAGMVGPLLGPLFPAALRCGSRSRSETALGAGPSLGRRAVDLGLALAQPSDGLVVMVVGSGQMAACATAHLNELGRRPLVAARDERRAAVLAGPGMVCPFGELRDGLARADLLICATSAGHHVVTAQHVAHAMARRERPMTVVDLSVPRNVDAAVGELPGVRLVDVASMHDDPSDDPVLHAAVEKAGELVAAAARQHVDRVNGSLAGPVIAAIRHQVRSTCLRELVAAAPPTADRDALARAAHAAAGRQLHAPTMAARTAAAAGDGEALLALCAQFDVRLPS